MNVSKPPKDHRDNLSALEDGKRQLQQQLIKDRLDSTRVGKGVDYNFTHLNNSMGQKRH
jgi:hypothetical protein